MVWKQKYTLRFATIQLKSKWAAIVRLMRTGGYSEHRIKIGMLSMHVSANGGSF